MNAAVQPLPGLSQLISTVKALRDPKTGCPWDRAQDHQSLKPYALEEVHEFIDSLDELGPNAPHTWEELGDVLFQVVLHSQLLSERHLTDLDTIAAQTAAKLIERHPHVFDPKGPRYSTPDEVNKAWEQLKAKLKGKEKSATPPPTRAQRVANVPKSLPSLQRAARIGEKAGSLGFDWNTPQEVMAKVQEELQELLEAQANETHAQEEFGDLLFALSQYARKRHWDPEALVGQASQKFLKRFAAMEARIEASGIPWESHSLEDLEAQWVAIKNV